MRGAREDSERWGYRATLGEGGKGRARDKNNGRVKCVGRCREGKGHGEGGDGRKVGE